MASPIEIVPGDRLVFMVGQPVIQLVADGGPGSDLGDLPMKRKARNKMARSGMGCCGSMIGLADLGCCGADERDDSGGMGQTNVATLVAVAAQAGASQCQKIQAQITSLLAAAKANPAKAQALNQKAQALQQTFHACLGQLNAVVGPNTAKLQSSGMGQIVSYAQKQTQLQKVQSQVVALQNQWKSHMNTVHGQ